MTEKFRKVDKEYILSDSTVNCYGYRLLTRGYQLAEFAKNPVGYYMHNREGGVVLRWEDLRVENDCVYGKPCINLSNPRGQQTFDEAEAGFLNAASVGHIVVLDYSTDAADMAEGQVGPTVTRWYNRECSLVDIPGNSNALASLYDEAGNEWLNALPVGPAFANEAMTDWANNLKLKATPGENKDNHNLNLYSMNEIKLSAEMLGILNLGGETDAGGVLNALRNIAAEASKVPELEAKLKNLEAISVKKDVEAILKQAQADKKVTRELKGKLESDYATNPKGLKSLIDAMPAYQSVTELINGRLAYTAAPDEGSWKWDDYEKNDPTGGKLKTLMANDPQHYKQLFDERFLGEKV